LAANLRANEAIPGLLLQGIAAPVPVISLYADDTTVITLSDCAILKVFFWAGKCDLVARKVLYHTKLQGGFSVVSVEFKLHSLLAQWFRRFGVSPAAWVSLLTF